MESDFEDDERNYQDNDYNSKNINLISPFKINKRKNKNNIHLKNEIFNKEDDKFNFIDNNKNDFAEINNINNFNNKNENNTRKKRGNIFGFWDSFYNVNFMNSNNNNDVINLDSNMNSNIINISNKNKDFRYIPHVKNTNNNYLKKNLNNFYEKNDNIILNKNINFNKKRDNNIVNLNNVNNNNFYHMNNKRQNNNFYKNRYLNLFNDFSPDNNINIDNDINFPKKIKPIDNDKFLNLQTNDYNYNKINIKRNQNKRNNFNKFLEYNNQINRNKRIMEQKEDLKKESESLSNIADDLYNYMKKQRKKKIFKIK